MVTKMSLNILNLRYHIDFYKKKIDFFLLVFKYCLKLFKQFDTFSKSNNSLKC